MRQLPPSLAGALATGATTLCRCWRVLRRDGVALGFTDHDGDLAFEGVTFAAASGMEPGAIEVSLGMAVDTQSVTGALTSAAIREEDLRRGLYRGAGLTQWIVDWRDPEARIVLFDGAIGEVTYSEDRFEAEVVGRLDVLGESTGRAYNTTCDANLGDMRCGVSTDAPEFTAPATVATVAESGDLVVTGVESFANDWFSHGIVTWVTGQNAGAVSAVRSGRVATGGLRLLLWFEPANPVLPGDTLMLTAGCDKQVATCRGKFANIRNFRGFPHMPGEDWVVNYPAQGGLHDGGSLFKS